MDNVLAKINGFKKRMKKNQCIVLIYDEYGGGDSDEFVNLKYVNHSSDTILCDDATEIDSEYFERIRHVMLVKKNFESKIGPVTCDKSPKTAKRHVGIELEFISKLSKPEIVMAMVEAGVEDNVTVKDDGSLDGDDTYQFTHEIAILATEKEFPKVIRAICKALKGNSTVNKSCGMHVHLDMRTRNPDMAYASLFEAQPVLYAMCPRSRREGTYSRPESNFLSVSKTEMDGDRYFGINKTAYEAHKTLEIRVHSGTLVADKIINWVKLLLKIVDNGQVYSLRTNQIRMVNSLTTFKKRTKLRGNLAKYVEERINSFKDDHRSIGEVFQLTA